MPGTARIEALLSAVCTLDTSEPGTLAEAAQLGAELETQLADPVHLQMFAAAIRRAAHKHHCRAVKGASTVGHYLAAAAAATSDNLSVVTNATLPARVLVVDHLLVTGFSLGRAAAAARAAGAETVYACVLAAVPNAQHPPGVQEVATVVDG